MVDTGVRAELQNCIRNAQSCMMELGQVLNQAQINDQNQKKRLEDLCNKTGGLLREAQERCEKIL